MLVSALTRKRLLPLPYVKSDSSSHMYRFYPRVPPVTNVKILLIFIAVRERRIKFIVSEYTKLILANLKKKNDQISSEGNAAFTEITMGRV